jgi:hypothetical protein
MEAKVKYKAIDSRGNQVYKTVTHTFPDFVEISKTFTVNGDKQISYTWSVDEQRMENLDSLDKRDLMYDNDWYAIIDYWLVQPKKKPQVKETVAALAERYLVSLENGPQLYVDFLAVYARLYKNIKSLRAEQQMQIVLDTLGVGYDAQSQAYKHAVLLLKSISDPEAREELKQLKLENNGNQIQGH